MRDTDLVITFFTFLTLLANAATLGLAGTAGAARITGRPAARRAWVRLHHEVAGGAVGLAWLVAAVAMSGSLYFSEVAGFTPCRLCWAQRACMYPLVALLAVAGLTRRPAWRALSLALATVGAGIAAYHVLVERFPTLESGTCDPANPCSLVWFERFGFVTLPYMALSGFALIGALLLTARVRAPAAEPVHGRDDPTGPSGHGSAPARLATSPRPPSTTSVVAEGAGREAAPTAVSGPPATAGTPTRTMSAARERQRAGAAGPSAPGSPAPAAVSPSTAAGTSRSASPSSTVPSPVSGPAASPGRAADATFPQENRS